MATSILTDTIKDPAGNVVATSSGTVVNFRLSANGSPTPGFRVSDGVNVASLIVTAATTSGTISQALENNSNIVPTGTYYVAEILCPTSQGGTQEWALLSSSSVSPQTFRSALAAVIPSFTPITTVPGSVLTGNNTFTGTNQFNGNVAFRTKLPEVDTLAYCAGDNATDDTVSFQAALNAAAGGLLHVNSATGYKITSQLTVPANTRIVGDGYASFLNFAVSDIGIGTTSATSRVEIANCRFGGSAARMIGFITTPSELRIHDNWVSGATVDNSSTYGAGIYVDSLTDVWIYNNTCSGNGIGSSSQSGLDNTHRSADILAYHGGANNPNLRLQVYGNVCTSTNVHFNIAAYNPQYSKFNNNHASGAISDTGNNSGYGILLYDSGIFISGRNVTEANNVRNTQGTGIYYADQALSRIVGNDLDTNATVQTDASLAVGGIVVNNSNQNDRCTISANVVRSAGRDGIVTSNNGTRHSITGNTVWNCTQAGIRVRGDNRYSSITANTVDACGTAGIAVNSTPTVGLVMSANTVTNTAAGGIGIDINTSTGPCTDFALSGNVVVANGGHGISIASSTNIPTRHTISANVCLNNGATTPGAYDGIRFTGTDTVVSGNVSLNSGTVNQSHGITDASTSGSGNILTGNDVSNNVTAGIVAISSGTIAFNNFGAHPMFFTVNAAPITGLGSSGDYAIRGDTLPATTTNVYKAGAGGAYTAIL